jgi:outer membrane protein assembly factor BamD
MKLRKAIVMALLLALALLAAGCRKNKSVNPIANIDSKQPDKVLFDRAMDALKHNKFDVARITLQTLINTYPDSEYVARAKLSIGDSWYFEGTAAALAQAEIEYKDFETFFPNMPEAAEAQMKVANIHYRQMEKPDRDFTHALRAEDEYRQMILQYPDSPLVPEAKKRLLQVQEVLAEREYRIGRFYFLQEAWPAAIARLKTLTDEYPLYSQADQALLMLGDAYEGEIENVRKANGIAETKKAQLIEKFTNNAAEAYKKILTRYPVMEASAEAKQRLQDLHLPVPEATPEAIAQNKSEEASRSETGRFGRIMNNFRRGPDTAAAATVGEPTLTDPQPTNATTIVREVVKTLSSGNNAVSVESNKDVKPGPNQPAPRSDSANPPKEEQAAPAPEQVNEAGHDGNAESSSASSSSTSASSNDKDPKDKKKEESSSKKKKKSGLRKLIPF